MIRARKHFTCHYVTNICLSQQWQNHWVTPRCNLIIQHSWLRVMLKRIKRVIKNFYLILHPQTWNWSTLHCTVRSLNLPVSREIPILRKPKYTLRSKSFLKLVIISCALRSWAPGMSKWRPVRWQESTKSIGNIKRRTLAGIRTLICGLVILVNLARGKPRKILPFNHCTINTDWFTKLQSLGYVSYGCLHAPRVEGLVVVADVATNHSAQICGLFFVWFLLKKKNELLHFSTHLKTDIIEQNLLWTKKSNSLNEYTSSL